jgi:hypothetical protein
MARTLLGLGRKDQALRVQRQLMTLDPKVAQDLLEEIDRPR